MILLCIILLLLCILLLLLLLCICILILLCTRCLQGCKQLHIAKKAYKLVCAAMHS